MKKPFVKIFLVLLTLYVIVNLGIWLIEAIIDKTPDVIIACVQSANESTNIKREIGDINKSEILYYNMDENSYNLNFSIALLGNKGEIKINYVARQTPSKEEWVILKSDTTRTITRLSK